MAAFDNRIYDLEVKAGIAELRTALASINVEDAENVSEEKSEISPGVFVPKGCEVVSKTEITELPEKFVIKVTNENRNALHGYMLKNKHRYPSYRDNWVLSGSWFKVQLNGRLITGGHSITGEIRKMEKWEKVSFSDFERLVLKKAQPEENIQEVDFEIDWSVPGQLLSDADGFIVFTSGLHDNLHFEASIIQGPLSIGKYATLLNKSEFKLFNGSIGLKN